jgi:hypothetical protein
MTLPRPEFLEEGVLAGMVVEAGFEEGKVRVLRKSVVVGGEDLEGLRGVLLGGFTKPARTGWSEEEEGRWEGVVEEVLREEVEAQGGVVFEAWVVLARK